MRRVLVVDDDEGLLFIIGEYLYSIGVGFHLANGAAQARLSLARRHFDLVISDLNMPGESGLDLFRSLWFKRPAIPFILMSGGLDPRLRRKAISMGVRDFLEKPFQLNDLRRIILDSDRYAHSADIGAPAA